MIVIKHGELMAEAEMEEDLQNYLKMNTYLDSADPWFWPKLRCVAELNRGREVIFLNSLFLDTHCHTEERSLPLEKGSSGPHSIRLQTILIVSDYQCLSISCQTFGNFSIICRCSQTPGVASVLETRL